VLVTYEADPLLCIILYMPLGIILGTRGWRVYRPEVQRPKVRQPPDRARQPAPIASALGICVRHTALSVVMVSS
jgi:hypothetical protein